MFAPFICQNISPCPPLILCTTSLAPHPIVTNQSFVNVVEIKTEMSSVVTLNLPFHQLEDFSQFFLIGAERGALLDFGV